MSAQPEYKARLFPAWYFEPMTEFQAARLADDGRNVHSSMTKGQASDLIGLGEDADEDDLEILRFFKKPARDMNGTKARHEVALLFLSDENVHAWKVRPASARTREFFKFLGIKVEPGMPETTARALMASTEVELREQGDARLDQWQTFLSILEEFDDRDFRDTYDIKKPTTKQVRTVIDRFLAEGKTWEQVGGAPEEIAERLPDEFPTLAK